MRIGMGSVLVMAGMLVSAWSYAQAPAGSTGECKDGTYTTAASKRGACSGHGGVKEWFGTAAAPAAAPAPAPAAKGAAAPAPAASTAQAPAGSTGQCKDGSYTTAASKRGACSGHGGVKEWFAGAAAAPAAAPAPAPAAKSAAAPAAAAPAAGGGPGKVWVNTASKVYHCPGDRWYGKTKQGEYMTEAAAKAAGNRADHGKACS